MKKYWIATYGCQMNISDSERIATALKKMNYSPASEIKKADLAVVTMCSIRQSAVDRIYGLAKNLNKLKNTNKKLKTVLTGCVLENNKKMFLERFDFVLPIKSLPYWKKILLAPKKDRAKLCQNMWDKFKLNKLNYSYLKIKPTYITKYSAYIPVIIGCNNFCSYCVVPYVRGPEISRPANDIIAEVKTLIKKKYKEIWLMGENVNSYNGEYKRPASAKAMAGKAKQKIDFPKLLEMIDKIPGNFWIRFSSSHPKDFSDKLIKTITNGKKITKYINLPVQSGNDKILKKMNRPYTIAKYKKIIKKIQREIPNVTLSTDVIVGFPGETKKEFNDTAKLFKEIEPDMAYVAQFSPRSGTVADKMEDDVSYQEKDRRDKELTKILEKTALKNNKKYIGKIVDVLPQYERKGFIIGKTKEYKTIKFKSDDNNLIGKFVKAKVIDTIPWGLLGELIE